MKFLSIYISLMSIYITTDEIQSIFLCKENRCKILNVFEMVESDKNQIQFVRFDTLTTNLFEFSWSDKNKIDFDEINCDSEKLKLYRNGMNKLSVYYYKNIKSMTYLGIILPMKGTKPNFGIDSYGESYVYFDIDSSKNIHLFVEE